MPRGKSHRRSEAAKRRVEAVRLERVGIPKASSDFEPQRGTGVRHAVRKWPVSEVTNHCHKLVVPEGLPNKKFVLLIGASHLRSLVDGIVEMASGCLQFGFISTPGAHAADLRLEVLNAVVPREPDAVCVMAPSNNLTASRHPEEAGQEFERYLLAVCSRWPKVFCTGFVPRLTESREKQEWFQQEFHRRSAKLGIRYYPIADNFPLGRRHLWCPDGIHLSDDHGMHILKELIWMFSYQFLELSAPKPLVQSPATPPYKPRFAPRVVVKGQERSRPSSPLPTEWTLVRSGRKRNLSGESDCLSDSPKKRVVHHQRDDTPVALSECAIPSNPVRFSPAILVAMETVSPSAVPDVRTGTETKPVEHQKKPAVSKSRRTRQKVSPVSCVTPATNTVVLKLPRLLVSDARPACPPVASDSPASGPACRLEVPSGQGTTEDVADFQRTQTSPKGQAVNPVPCRCSTGLPPSLVAGTFFGTNHSSSDTIMSCSVVAAIKHHISPVCTWKTSDVDEVGVEGRKLAEYVARERPNRGPKPELCKLVEDLTIFGRKWKVVTGNIVFGTFGFEQEEELYEILNKYLLRDGMCIFSLHGATSLIIQHGLYFVVVDFGTRNSQGLASQFGTSVVVFNTCLNDLMIHLLNLRESLNATEYGIFAISVQEMYSNVETCAAVTADRQATDACHSASSHVASLSGSFHQGDVKFKYAGVQCTAISAVALTKHTLDSVFSWNADILDDVVVLGDQLYTFLRDNNLISGGSQLLSVPDLPKKMHVDGQSFEYAYGDYVAGAIDTLDPDLLESGVHTSLWDGLSKMCAKYETNFITISGSTCALISSNGRYAVVDSHARNTDGMVHATGKSVVLYFNTLDDVFVYIERFSGQLNVTPKLFEISGVDIVQTGSSKIASEHVAAVPGSSSGVFDHTFTGVDMQDDSCGEHSSQLDMSDMDDDVVVTGVQSKVLYFNPVSEEIARSLCGKLNVEYQRANSVSCVVGELGVPCLTEKIVGDGNCFFRALSQAISGTQKNHRKIRLAVVKQLQRNSHTYDSILRSEYSSISQYIAVSRMQYVGSWATEVEIKASADYFGVNIFTFCDDKWLEYSSLSSLSNHALYLQNISGNHYETVTCVKQPRSQTCYGYCMNSDLSGEYKTRKLFGT
ncbi:uncharacterized protein LOC111611089 [Xiphophorus maculatus]|uniref:uncharacterized protein LOC111611089 n=1 Tax=Xiphophorus maculatus TaxID=8083 RepID=UPI000C6E7D5E|nr:uncharacterized protein LOC111611089 [Xiphophorus maculatus]